MTDQLTPAARDFLAALGQSRAAAHYAEHQDLGAARAFGWEAVNVFKQAMYDGFLQSIDNGAPEPDRCLGVPVTYDPSKLPRPYGGRKYGK